MRGAKNVLGQLVLSLKGNNFKYFRFEIMQFSGGVFKLKLIM